MADKAISELIAAEQITATDLFVLQQNNTAKKLSGQVLLNWLTAAADGHGGIQSIAKTNTQGLVDTYTITLADTTTFSFNVTNGKSIQSITKTGTSGLVDTYRIAFNDGTSQTYTVTNGEKGDKGDNAYVHIKWASQDPSMSPHSFGDIPDNWMGVYSGNASAAPTSWNSYDWFEVKGEKGDTGDAAAIISQEIVYQVSDSGTIYPSGEWSQTVPVVPAGKYLWTRTTITFNSGSPIVSYSVGRMGIDGQGAVSTVNNVSPDSDGNVTLTAEALGAMPATGGEFTGPVNMNGQTLSGLNLPTAADHAANRGYVDGRIGDIPSNQSVKDYVDDAVEGVAIDTDTTLTIAGAAADAKATGDAIKKNKPSGGNIFDNYYFVGGGTANQFPINQKGAISWNTSGYMFDRWIIDVGAAGTAELEVGCLRLHTEVNAMILSQRIEYIDDTRTYTASILADGVLHVATGSFPAKGGANATWTSKSGNAVISAANPSEGFPEVFFNFPKSSASRLVIAAGLNPGEEQTIFVETSGGGI